MEAGSTSREASTSSREAGTSSDSRPNVEAGSCLEGGCGAGLTCCARTCVDTSSDTLDCGACGAVCPSGEVCHVGSCAAGCVIAGTFYGNGAVNSANACQGCEPSASTTAWTDFPMGISCGGGMVCDGMGACGCPSGLTACGSAPTAACVNLQTDGNDCGACSNVCPSATTCSSGCCSTIAGTASASTSVTSASCSGFTFGASLSLSGASGNIQWQSSPDGATGWAGISGATSATWSGTVSGSGAYYRALVTRTCGSSATSNVVFAGIGSNTKTYTASSASGSSSSTYSWTAPAGVTQVLVQVWGEGGGGAIGECLCSGGSAGGGGAGYAGALLPVTPGTTYSIVAGGGWDGNCWCASSSGDGYTGSTSSFGGSLLVANGGGGAAGCSSGGAGGTATSSISGALLVPGVAGTAVSSGSGAGGASGCSSAGGGAGNGSAGSYATCTSGGTAGQVTLQY